MVEKSIARLGLDRRGSLYFAARVEFSNGRPEVKALARFEKEHISGHKLLEEARVILSVEESAAMIKRLKINGNGSNMIDAKARFELSQTVFGNQSEFTFETISTGLDSIYLGTIVRLSSVNPDFLNLPESNISYRVRAVAMAKAFATFCRKESGQLTAMLDFIPDYVSVAFVYRENLIGIEFLKLKDFDLENESQFTKVTIELKTLINYRLASLFNDGLTVPLAHLYITGHDFSEKQMTSLKNNIAIDISRPEINRGFFPEPDALEKIPLDQYLVALGLAVN